MAEIQQMHVTGNLTVREQVPAHASDERSHENGIPCATAAAATTVAILYYSKSLGILRSAPGRSATKRGSAKEDRLSAASP